LGAERRAAHYFLMAWKSGCSVPTSDIICTEYWQDLYRQLYTVVSYVRISADSLIMCSLQCSFSHSCETSITKTQVCNSSKYILHTAFHKHKYLPYYGFVLVGQIN
jgi:hypothetical protein